MTPARTDAHRIASKSLNNQEIIGLLFAVHFERERSNGVLPSDWRPHPEVPTALWTPPLAYARQYGAISWPPIDTMCAALKSETGIECRLVGDKLLLCNCDESMYSDLNKAIEGFVAKRKESKILCIIAVVLFVHILSWMVLAGWPVKFLADRQHEFRMWFGVMLFWTSPSLVGAYFWTERLLKRRLGKLISSRAMAKCV
jgi:hypothetical protein